ncbi:MAG: hypothetical protein ACW98X_24440 [Promethearchaeota archaeon]|jgi:hypothetical protein
MPELTEAFINLTDYPDPTYVTEWFNVSSSQNIVFTAFSDQNFDMVVEWSVDNQHQIIDTDVKNIVGGSTGEFFLPIKSRFARLSVINIASNPAVLRVQAFFFLTNNLGLHYLNNIGGYAELFKPYNELRTIQSSNGSVTVIQNADDIDLQAMTDVTTLTSAGGVNGLVVDGTGPTLSTKGLTSGTAIGLVSGANEITISNTSLLSGWLVELMR